MFLFYLVEGNIGSNDFLPIEMEGEKMVWDYELLQDAVSIGLFKKHKSDNVMPTVPL